MISELSNEERKQAKSPTGRLGELGEPAKLVSARDTKLTQILGPLLAGNSKTWVLATVRETGAHFEATCHTLKTAMQVRKRSQIIKLLFFYIPRVNFTIPPSSIH